jgi:hypothetical protein
MIGLRGPLRRSDEVVGVETKPAGLAAHCKEKAE